MVLFFGVTILLASTYVTLNSDTAKDSVVKVAPLDGILADNAEEGVGDMGGNDVKVNRDGSSELRLYISSVYCLFSDGVGLPLHNIPSSGVLVKSIEAIFFTTGCLSWHQPHACDAI